MYFMTIVRYLWNHFNADVAMLVVGGYLVVKKNGEKIAKTKMRNGKGGNIKPVFNSTVIWLVSEKVRFWLTKLVADFAFERKANHA